MRNVTAKIDGLIGSVEARVCNALVAIVVAFSIVPGEHLFAQELQIIPAEEFISSPGGVDMRTGRYIYRHVDLSAGEGGNAFSLERIMPDYAAGHANPFGNFSHNFDIWMVESRVNLDAGGTTSGVDYRINIHIGGRSVTFDSKAQSVGYRYAGSGPDAKLNLTGDRASASALYTLRDADGTIINFRPIGSGDCSSFGYRRCAFVSSLVRPDGTHLDFSYVASGGGSHNGARLTRVVSSRGFTLILEGTGNRVTKACLVNTRTNTPPVANICPAGVPTSTYSYASTTRSRLATMTDAAGGQWSFTYSGSQMGYVNPGDDSAWLTNTISWRDDEEGSPQEIITRQNFSDGSAYTYSYNLTPTTNSRPIATIIGGSYTNNSGAKTIINYDHPVLPGSRQGETCAPHEFPCTNPLPDPWEYWVWQTTPGPVEIIDPLGRKTTFNYCDPVVETGLPPQYQDRCAVVPTVDVTDPKGIQTFFKYDGSQNVTEARQVGKVGSALADIVRSATYDCSNPASCTKPLTSTDANGNLTERTYASGHGGMVSEMLPAPSAGGARPLKLISWTQRYVWTRNTSGSLVRSENPIWTKVSETQCQTLPGVSPAASCDGGAPVRTTTYEYGAAGTGESLLVKGITITAAGETLRTCYGYDAMGRKISETGPRAGLASCQ